MGGFRRRRRERYREPIRKLYWGICITRPDARMKDIENVVRGILAVAFSFPFPKLMVGMIKTSCQKAAPKTIDILDIIFARESSIDLFLSLRIRRSTIRR